MYLLWLADQRRKQNHKVVPPASSSTRTVPVRERIWIDIEPGTPIRSGVPRGKKNKHPSSEWTIITSRRRWTDRILGIIIGTNVCTLNIGLMKCGRVQWQKAEATRKIFQHCTDPSGQEIHYLRALQGHSGRNPIDPTIQDIVKIPNDFVEYIYHIGCEISLHSVTDSGLITGGQNSSRKRQPVFFTALNPMTKDHRDPQELDLTKPRLASYKQKKKWKKHQDTVYLVDIQLAQRKGLKFYQSRCNAIILHDRLPAYCISKVVEMESGEIISLCVTSTTTDDFFQR